MCYRRFYPRFTRPRRTPLHPDWMVNRIDRRELFPLELLTIKNATNYEFTIILKHYWEGGSALLMSVEQSRKNGRDRFLGATYAPVMTTQGALEGADEATFFQAVALGLDDPVAFITAYPAHVEANAAPLGPAIDRLRFSARFPALMAAACSTQRETPPRSSPDSASSDPDGFR